MPLLSPVAVCRREREMSRGFRLALNPASIHETGRGSETELHPIRPLYMNRTQHSPVNRVLQKGLFDSPRGGARPGAGRKPKKGRRGVPHTTRSRVTRHDVIHITQRIDTHGFSLRTGKVLAVLRACFTAGAERFGFRLIEYSIQRDHLHLIVEAECARKNLFQPSGRTSIRVDGSCSEPEQTSAPSSARTPFRRRVTCTTRCEAVRIRSRRPFACSRG